MSGAQQLRPAPMCESHRAEMFHRLGVGPDDSWLVYDVTGMILLTQQTLAEPDAPAVDAIGTVGCLACWSRRNFERMLRILAKGTQHAAQVARRVAYDTDHVWGLCPKCGGSGRLPIPGQRIICDCRVEDQKHPEGGA